MPDSESEFQLSAEQRSALRAHYDADALQVVLARDPAAVRAHLLSAATRPALPTGQPQPSALRRLWTCVRGRSRRRQAYLPTQLEDYRVSDPELQRLLERVWQPRRGRL